MALSKAAKSINILLQRKSVQLVI